MIFKASDIYQWKAWISELQNARNQSDIGPLTYWPFESFSPKRRHNDVTFYVDGEGYFEWVEQEIRNAQKSIYITDWWLSPELYLTRPATYTNETGSEPNRLDHLLKVKADQGVKVYILVYKEVTFSGLYNNSQHVLTMFDHPNIHAMRHPRTVICFWSHHEKMVCVDQQVGCMGGLDLCYGWWDTNEHPLKDIGVNGKYLFPGIDYSNSRTNDFKDTTLLEPPLIDRNSHPRMPWHDIAMCIYG